MTYASKKEEPSVFEAKLLEGARFLQDVDWPINHNTFEFTTLVSIVPNTFPFPACTSPNCTSKLV